MLFITGASGSGKSVLLRLAMGLLRPDEGQIFVLGRELSSLEEDEILTIRSEGLGMVFQEEALFTGMDVYHNDAFACRSTIGQLTRSMQRYVRFWASLALNTIWRKRSLSFQAG